MTAPVQRDVTVNASVGHAFEVFTSQIGSWWPLTHHGVLSDGTVAFEEEQLVERSGDRLSVWGEVLEWDPPRAFSITWHPGYARENGTRVYVSFTERNGRTLVTLVHSGWERMTDPDASAAEYSDGWPGVLSKYRELVEEVSA